ncbi:MAG: MogA/MoaB family molybdenum cofactor biosynthesis protein [Adlercreutzia sp.]
MGCKSHVVVPDERPFIASAIVRACDEQDVDVVLTCGGSGLSLRDVSARGHDGRVRSQRARHSRSHARAFAGPSPYAMLSRARCACSARPSPGDQPARQREGCPRELDGVVKALPHAVKMMAGGGREEPLPRGV